MAKTQRAAYWATVKERSGGETPFLMFEPIGESMPLLKNAFVALDLRPGTTLDQAQELARHLHAHVEGLSISTRRC